MLVEILERNWNYRSW